MSTKSTIKHGEIKSGSGFHVYRDLMDDDSKDGSPKFIHLELDRCEYEASFVNGASWVDVKIPAAIAVKIGLMKNKRKW